MLREPDTLITAPPATVTAATRPPGRGHRVIWFAIGLGLFTIDACLLIAGLRLTWILLHL